MAASTLDLFINIAVKNQEAVTKFSQQLVAVKRQADELDKDREKEGIKTPSKEEGEKAASGWLSLWKAAGQVSFEFNNIHGAIQRMMGAARPGYEWLIGANERLNQQLLQSAATITATSKVQTADGRQLTNLASIRALGPELKKTIREVEKATQELVGVTSAQTSEVFNVILQNTGKLNGQLKAAAGGADKFKDPLDAAAKLAPGLVATLGTLGLPMQQAADEVGNLLKGEIDSTAQVAKSLGITREMIENWKSQGTLVNELTKKFDPFLKANKEAARSVSGITSNMKDLLEIMGREAGKPLAAAFVDILDVAYKVLEKVIPPVQKALSNILEQVVSTAKRIYTAVEPVFNGIAKAVIAIFPTIEPAIKAVMASSEQMITSFKPAFEAIGSIISSVGVAIAALIPVITAVNQAFTTVLATAITGVFTALSPVIFLAVEGIKLFANTLAAINANPFGAVILQAALMTTALAAVVPPILAMIAGIKAFVLSVSLLSGAFGFFGALSATLTPISPALAGVAGSAGVATGAMGTFFGVVKAGFATGGISGAISAIGTALAGVGTAAGAATVPVTGLMATLGPLLAIGGAIALTFIWKGTQDMKNAQEEVDQLAKTSDDIAVSMLETSGKLKALQDKASKGQLSNKEKEELKQQIFAGKQRVALAEDQIKANKALREQLQSQGAAPEQLAAIDALNSRLENGKKTLSSFANSVKISSQEVERLGTTQEQVAKKAKAANDILVQGVGDPVKYKESAKEQQTLLETQVKIGQVTAEEAAKLLTLQRNNAKLDYETQLAAKEAIVKIYQTRFNEIEKLRNEGKLGDDGAVSELQQIKNNTELEFSIRKDAAEKIKAIRKQSFDADLAEQSAAQAEIAAKQAAGVIGEAESARQITESKIAESKIRIRQQREELDNELNPEARRKLAADIRKSQAELTKIEAEERERRNKERLKDFDEAQKMIQRDFDKGRISEEQYNQELAANDEERSAEEIRQLDEKFAKLQSTDKEGREAIQAQIAEAESKQEKNREAAINREVATLKKATEDKNKLLQAALDKGQISEEEYNKERAAAEIDAADAEIELLKDKLSKVSSTNVKAQEDLLVKIAEAESKKEQVRKQSMERELALLEQHLGKQADLIRNAESERKLEIERAVADGRKTRAEGNAEAAQEAIRAAEQQISLEREKLNKLKSLTPPSNEREREALEDKIRDQQNKQIQAEIDLISRRNAAQRAAIDQVAEENKKAGESLERSQQRRLETLKQNELKALQEKNFDLEAINRRSAAQNLEFERESTEQRYRLKLDEIARFDALVAEGKVSNEERLSTEARLQKELSDINLQRIAQEKQALEQLRAEKVRQIELETQKGVGTLQKKIDLLTIQKSLLQSQNELMEAQSRLESASFNLQKQRLGFAIEDARARGDEKGARQLEVQAAAEQLAFTRQQNKVKIESLLLSQEQKALDLSMAQIQAQIATIQAKANLEKAIVEGKSQVQIDALKREVALREQQEGLSARAIANNKIISEKALKTAQIEGQISEEAAARGLQKAVKASAEAPNSDAQAQATDKAIQSTDNFGKGLDGATNAVSAFASRLTNTTVTQTPIPARFTGGPVEAGETFMGAEQGPELARYADGTYDLLRKPGIYNLSRNAQIIPADRTSALLRNSSMMGGGGAVQAPNSIVLDQSAMVHELQKLHALILNRRPTLNVPVSFSAPVQADQSFKELSRMLSRSI